MEQSVPKNVGPKLALVNVGGTLTEQLALQNKLRDSLLEAQKRNSGYSLRAFAKKLQMSPSALSEILSGKRKVSKDLAEKILRNIGSNPREQHKILSLFEAGKTGFSKSNYLEISADQFHVIADWYHFAVLSLAETKGFRAEPLWIAKRLGIKLQDAEVALERLHRLGMAKWSRKQKTLELTNAQFTTSDDIANQAIRKSHQEDLEISSRLLEEVSVEKRDFTSMTMAIDASKMAQAKKMIRDFQDQMSTLLESGEKTEVYKLCVHLMPLSKENV